MSSLVHNATSPLECTDTETTRAGQKGEWSQKCREDVILHATIKQTPQKVHPYESTNPNNLVALKASMWMWHGCVLWAFIVLWMPSSSSQNAQWLMTTPLIKGGHLRNHRIWTTACTLGASQPITAIMWWFSGKTDFSPPTAVTSAHLDGNEWAFLSACPAPVRVNSLIQLMNSGFPTRSRWCTAPPWSPWSQGSPESWWCLQLPTDYNPSETELGNCMELCHLSAGVLSEVSTNPDQTNASHSTKISRMAKHCYLGHGSICIRKDASLGNRFPFRFLETESFLKCPWGVAILWNYIYARFPKGGWTAYVH